MAKPEDIVADGLSLVPAFGGILSRRARGLKLSSQAKLEDHMAQVHWEWLGDAIEALPGRVAKLIEQSPHVQPSAPDVGSIIEAALTASRRTADPRKRQCLRNAVVNAFDPILWEQGMTLRVLKFIEDLEYPDLFILSELDRENRFLQELEAHFPKPRQNVPHLLGFILGNLQDVKLAWKLGTVRKVIDGQQKQGTGFTTTTLGSLVVAHIREPGE